MPSTTRRHPSRSSRRETSRPVRAARLRRAEARDRRFSSPRARGACGAPAPRAATRRVARPRASPRANENYSRRCRIATPSLRRSRRGASRRPTRASRRPPSERKAAVGARAPRESEGDETPRGGAPADLPMRAPDSTSEVPDIPALLYSFPSAVFTGRGASRNRGEKKEFGKKNRRRTGPRGATLISPSRASHRRDWSAVSRAAMQFGVETLPPGCVSRLPRPARTFLARISRSSRS
jgi:hypothetical protein